MTSSRIIEESDTNISTNQGEPHPDCREAEYADSLLNMLQRQSAMVEVGWAELKVSHSQANVQQLEGAINNHILGISGLRLF